MSQPWPEPTLSREVLFEGRIIHLERHVVQLRSGQTGTREVVRHPGAVAVVAEPEPGQLLFVRQYRKAAEEELLEIPAGKLEPGEDPAVCAQRELEEETGYRVGRITQVATFYTSPGFADERIHLYYAADLKTGQPHPDPDEDVEVVTADLETISQWLQSGALRDAKTLVGVLWWLRHHADSHAAR